MDEAVKMMAEETGYIILDVRRPDEFAAGHIPKAINVPNETIGTADIPELPDKNLISTSWSLAVSSIGRARSLPTDERCNYCTAVD